MIEKYMLESAENTYEFHAGGISPYSTGTKGLTKLELGALIAFPGILNIQERPSKVHVDQIAAESVLCAAAVLKACHEAEVQK